MNHENAARKRMVTAFQISIQQKARASWTRQLAPDGGRGEYKKENRSFYLLKYFDYHLSDV